MVASEASGSSAIRRTDPLQRTALDKDPTSQDPECYNPLRFVDILPLMSARRVYYPGAL